MNGSQLPFSAFTGFVCAYETILNLFIFFKEKAHGCLFSNELSNEAQTDKVAASVMKMQTKLLTTLLMN